MNNRNDGQRFVTRRFSFGRDPESREIGCGKIGFRCANELESYGVNSPASLRAFIDIGLHTSDLVPALELLELGLERNPRARHGSSQTIPGFPRAYLEGRAYHDGRSYPLVDANGRDVGELPCYAPDLTPDSIRDGGDYDVEDGLLETATPSLKLLARAIGSTGGVKRDSTFLAVGIGASDSASGDVGVEVATTGCVIIAMPCHSLPMGGRCTLTGGRGYALYIDRVVYLRVSHVLLRQTVARRVKLPGQPVQRLTFAGELAYHGYVMQNTCGLIGNGERDEEEDRPRPRRASPELERVIAKANAAVNATEQPAAPPPAPTPPNPAPTLEVTSIVPPEPTPAPAAAPAAGTPPALPAAATRRRTTKKVVAAVTTNESSGTPAAAPPASTPAT